VPSPRLVTAGGFLNGMAADWPAGRLYVADSAHPVIWSVPVHGGAPAEWATGDALTPISAGVKALGSTPDRRAATDRKCGHSVKSSSPRARQGAQAAARSRRTRRSRSLRVSVAARSYSERASPERPSRDSRSARTLGSRW
jgi:hypothetical protein